MKRFLAFDFDTYYILGGINDLRGSFDDLQEAIDFLVKREKESSYEEFMFTLSKAHVYDTIEQKTVWTHNDYEQ